MDTSPLFIHSLVDGHLGRFPPFAYCEQSCNGTFMHEFLLNICFQSGGIYLQGELLGHMVIPMFNFWDIKLFPTVAVPLYIPNSSA